MSYLNYRKQIVGENNSFCEIYVLSGAPQSSHLSLLLLSLFMNDLPNMINFANILTYADDVKVILSSNNSFLWCEYNMTELNITYTHTKLDITMLQSGLLT